ncbi:maleylacetoacetate isomerase [Schauerella aestuarii]|uniref:maleylacetoacetate isomerase n=1 Tax=Schauerella aestuarii TaxID=2511204 RepID=UPI00136EAA56|nr:maleylacetoacetate isomerase [Achromobacter aestuarii]MYZ43261.1 maleylacetoacetate isomerase [Achromobacter aestuarii]
MQLYSYFRSSAAYRVRIALNLKGLPYDYVPVHLLKDGGQQRGESYVTLNPQGLVPTFVDDELIIGQSLATIEYLDETHPEPSLLPGSPADRARIRDMALMVACDIHPINNLRILKYLKHTLQVDDDAKDAWYRHWTEEGLRALESRVANDRGTGAYCHGDVPTLADICLVPQMANARRFNCDLSGMPTLVRIDEACRALPAFEKAAPQNQPDAE